jgi:hypothetical protein
LLYAQQFPQSRVLSAYIAQMILTKLQNYSAKSFAVKMGTTLVFAKLKAGHIRKIN